MDGDGSRDPRRVCSSGENEGGVGHEADAEKQGGLGWGRVEIAVVWSGVCCGWVGRSGKGCGGLRKGIKCAKVCRSGVGLWGGGTGAGF